VPLRSRRPHGCSRDGYKGAANPFPESPEHDLLFIRSNYRPTDEKTLRSLQQHARASAGFHVFPTGLSFPGRTRRMRQILGVGWAG